MAPSQHENIKRTLLRRNYLSRQQLLQREQFKVKPQGGGRKPRLERPFKMCSKIMRTRTIEDRKRIIHCRFGSLSDFRVVKASISSIASRLYMPWSTVHAIVYKFVRNGHSFDAFNKQDKRFRCIPARLQRELLSEETLDAWKSNSLRERVKIIWSLHRVKVSYYSLQQFCKHHNVTYKSSKAVYRSYISNQPRLTTERKQFSLLLGNLIANKVPLIYQDETTCNSFIVRKKSWSIKYKRNIHHRDNKRFSVTILGAISEHLQGKICFMLAPTTNAASYQEFLKLCKGKMVSDCKAVMLYDGHRAHTTE